MAFTTHTHGSACPVLLATSGPRHSCMSAGEHYGIRIGDRQTSSILPTALVGNIASMSLATCRCRTELATWHSSKDIEAALEDLSLRSASSWLAI